MSLRPPLHVSTFHSRTVVSMIGRLCHLFVHAVSSLQVANAQCMTLRSLAPCLRAAREKHRFAAGKKHRNGKKHVWQQEKNALQREKAVSAAGKNASKKCRFAAGKIQSSRKKHLAAAQKHLCSRKNAFWRQREKTVRGGKKPVRGKKKTGRGRKKTSSRESPALQPKKLPQRKKYISATGKSSSPHLATQKVAATEKTHFRNGKKQQPGVPPDAPAAAETEAATDPLPTAVSTTHEGAAKDGILLCKLVE